MSEMPPTDPMPPTLEAPRAEGIPWEEPSARLGSLFPTIGQFVTSPVRAYSKMSLTVDLIRPIAYFVAFVLFSAVVSQLWNLVLFDRIAGFARAFLPPQFQQFIAKPSALQIVLGLVISPLVSLIVLFVWSGLLHLTLLLLGGATQGFAATLRVACYASTSDLAVAVPLFGGLFGWVWRRVLEGVGLCKAHRTEGWKAVLAVVIPVFVCCLCLVGTVSAFGAVILQALQQMK